MGHYHQHRDFHAHKRQDNPWEVFTKAVGDTFGFGDDGPADPPKPGDNNGKGGKSDNGPGDGPGDGGNDNGDGPKTTIVRTVRTTQTPEGFTGRLSTMSVDDPTPIAGASTKTAKPTTTQKPSSDRAFPSSLPVTTPASVAKSLDVDTASPTTSRTLAAVDVAGSSTPTTSAISKSADDGGSSAGAKAGIAIGVLGGIFLIAMAVFIIIRKRRNQMERQRLEDDEKINGPFGAAPIQRSDSTRSAPNAPRLSLRPVTQFSPNLHNGGAQTAQTAQVVHMHPERRISRGAMNAGPAGMARNGAGSPWERPMTANSAHSANPFGDHAERAHTPNSYNGPVSPALSGSSDVGTAMSTNSPPTAGPLAAAAVGAAAAGAGMAAAGMARKASIRKEGPKALDLTVPPPKLSAVPPSPAGTEFSVNSVSTGITPGPSASAAAIAAAGGPAVSSVHRVQLDFKSTMEDEMDLQAGQLIRLLHEYDDGWALCIRLDRSQQGVVPRTCLSTRPVKPRPAQGGPRGPPVKPSGPGARGPNYPQGQRPMTPQGGPPRPRPESPAGRPMTAPGQGRPQSPMGRPMSPAQAQRSMSPAPRGPMNPAQARPMSPAQGRPMSPGPRAQSPGPRYQGQPQQQQQQGRPQSPSNMNRRMSPPGPSAMSQEYRPNQQQPQPKAGPIGRKPVPGQAY